MTIYHLRQKQISQMPLAGVLEAIRILSMQSQFSTTAEMQIRSYLLFKRLEAIAPDERVRELARSHLEALSKLMEGGSHSSTPPPSPGMP